MSLSPKLSPPTLARRIAYKNNGLRPFFEPLIIERDIYIYVLLSPKEGKHYEIIIERACFDSGDKSGDTF